MKKLIICLTLLVGGVGVSMAQNAEPRPGSWKAKEKIDKANNLMLLKTPQAVADAQAIYAEVEGILSGDIEKAKADQKNDKLAQLYYQNAQVQYQQLIPELEKAQQNVPFDTLNFCKRVDNTIMSYVASADYNTQPNAKGKVKTDKTIQAFNKAGLMGLAGFYYYCGAFMDAVGNKQESVDFFQKFVDLPKSTKLFSEAERDSIYAESAKVYSQARFNLALQNFYLKNWDKAIECSNEALKDTVSLNDLYIIKINAYGEKKDSLAWQRTLVEAAKRTGQSSFIQSLLYYYIQNNKVKDATDMATTLVAEDANDKVNWFVKGAIEMNIQKDYAAARASFEKALAIDPDYQDALFNMGTAYINDIYDQRLAGKYKFVGMDQVVQSNGKAVKAADKATAEQQVATVKSYYEKALPYLDHLRKLTPNDAKRWASPLQIVYSSLNQMDMSKEMDALLDAANKASM